MSCLLCLRNEGIHLPNESSNEFQILLQLFSLPQEFLLNLEGNKCCSLCRVKLQFVQVLNEEMLILSEKLKCFEKEVKGIFVSSFQENQMETETDEMASEARRKLFKELNIFNSEVSPNEISIFKIEEEQSLPFYQSEDVEFPISDPLANPQIIIPHYEEFLDETGEKQETDNDDSSEKSVEYLKTFSVPKSAKDRRFKWHKKVTQPKQLVSFMVNKNSQSGRKMRKYVCALCPLKPDFSQTNQYENHMKSIHPTRGYSTCPICSRIVLECLSFSEGQKRMQLKKHMEIHQKTRPFPCDLCDLSFKTNKTLKTHMEIHMKRELLTCDICFKGIRGERNMNLHLRNQHGNWNFNCTLCGLKSRKEGGPNLEKHLRDCKKGKII